MHYICCEKINSGIPIKARMNSAHKKIVINFFFFHSSIYPQVPFSSLEFPILTPYFCFLLCTFRIVFFFHRLLFHRFRVFAAFPDGSGTFIKSDQIRAMRRLQRFPDEVVIFWIPVLDQCPLHGFFMGISRYINRFHCPWIQPRIIHTGRQGGRRRIKVLNLFRHIAKISQIFRQGNGLFHR